MIPTTRIMMSTLLPLLLTLRSYKKKSVNASGAVTGFMVALIVSLASHCFLFDLLIFFVTSSIATRYKQDLKAKIEENFKEGGQRSWVQVVCNGGVATYIAVLYLFNNGSGERPIDFSKDNTASWYSIGIMSAFAFGNADTWASELGTVMAKSDPRLITTWKKVPTGTNGGVTIAGTVLSTLGGLVVGLTHYATIIIYVSPSMLALAPAQWPIVFYGAIAGLLGSLLDSLLGATIQYSGISKSGKIVSNPDLSVQHISGRNVLSNHNVNLLTTVIISVTIPKLANMFWCL